VNGHSLLAIQGELDLVLIITRNLFVFSFFNVACMHVELIAVRILLL